MTPFEVIQMGLKLGYGGFLLCTFLLDGVLIIEKVNNKTQARERKDHLIKIILLIVEMHIFRQDFEARKK